MSEASGGEVVGVSVDEPPRVPELGPPREPVRAGDAAKETAYQAVIQLIANPPPVARRSQVMLISLGLFMLAWLSRRGQQSLPELGILVGVLLAHELGHAVAMRLSGYTDVRIFFIPFFGAAAAGKKRGVARWKEGVVLLAGPLPGIIAGTVMLLVGVEDLARTAALTMLVVNVLNLLPVAPLDGGQLFQLVVFSRHRHLEVGFLVVAGIGLIVGYLFTESFVMILIGAMVLAAAPARARVLAAGVTLRPLELPNDPRALDDDQRRRVFDDAWQIAQSRTRQQPRLLATVVEALVEVATRKPLSARASGLLLAGWLAGWGIAAFGAVHVYDARPAQWASYHNQGGRFAIEFPAEPTEGETGPTHMLTAVRGPKHEYGAIWLDLPAERVESWVPAMRSTLLKDQVPLRDISPSEFVYERDGRIVHTLLEVRGTRGYIVMATSPTDEPDSERVIRSFRPD